MADAGAPDLAAVADLVRRLAEAIARPDATALDVARAAGGDVADDGAPLGVKARGDVPGVEQVSVTRQWDSELPNAAAIALAPGLTVAQLEGRLGEARAIPGVRPGEQLVVLGSDAGDATTLAALDASGDVRGITVRRET